MFSTSKFVLTATAVVLCAVTPAFGGFLAGGGINQSGPGLPPSNGGYVSPQDVHACYDITGFPGNPLCLVQGNHSFFTNPDYSNPAGTSDGQDRFGSTFTGQATGAFFGTNHQPVVLQGPVSITIFGRPTNNLTGTFSTEMTQLDLTGGVTIRESPTLASLGSTKITDLGGGSFHIDSFFDIFTELSTDGGGTWHPSIGSTHMDLVSDVPEPSSVLLLLGGLALLTRRGLRRASR